MKNAHPTSLGTRGFLHGETAWRRFRERLTLNTADHAMLSAEARLWLDHSPPTIVNKKHCALGGTAHDYLSLSPYLWPDPEKSDGLPWIGRDGELNPLFYEYDNYTLETFCAAVTKLLLFSEATGSSPHARTAGRFLRAWFVDERTRMNPHLRHGQFIPGKNTGRPIGIIDTNSLVFVLDLALRMPLNDQWTREHVAGLKSWVSAYLDWLLTDEFGRLEQAGSNNHGTWYDVQVGSFALFCDRPEIARRQIAAETILRLESQLAPDGSQPRELERTLSFTYSTYNLLGFACAARIAACFDLNLWEIVTNNGTSLRSALRWMLPYFAGARKWDHPQIELFDRANSALLLNLAWQGTGDPDLFRLMQEVGRYSWHEIAFSKPSFTGRKAPQFSTA